MGKTEIDGEQKFFAFNLTRNQSVDQVNYNENVIWLEGESFPMPPVVFTHKDGKKKANEWHIRDEAGQGLVDITFKIDNVFYMPIPVAVYYALPYGKIYGYVTDTNGKNTPSTAWSVSAKTKQLAFNLETPNKKHFFAKCFFVVKIWFVT